MERKIKLLAWLVIVGAITPAQAQNVTLDGSLGRAQTLQGPSYEIPQSIGQTVGRNLFHSFGQFNLSSNEIANFQSNGVTNIFARITGGRSRIDGRIQAEPNLFLINPNGIVFGANARLDVRGSFVATTADAIQFGDRGSFKLNSKPSDLSLLTIQPSALLFNQIPQAIVDRSSNLSVKQGQSLLLVGGEVNLEGGQLTAPGGRIELGGLSKPGAIGLTINNNQFNLAFSVDITRSDVLLNNNSRLDVTAEDGGNIAINARTLRMLEESRLAAGIATGLGTSDSRGGDIEVNATDTITLVGSSIFNTVETGSIGKGGDVRITTGSLSLSSGAQLEAITYGQGNAGNVFINARDAVSIDGNRNEEYSSGVFSNVGQGGIGKGGSIYITTGSISLTNGAQLIAINRGRGDAGNIFIDARDAVSFDGTSRNGSLFTGAFSSVEPRSIGQGGNIRIAAKSVLLTNRARLDSTMFGRGDAGDIIISTDSLSLTNGAQVNASTIGQGNAGNIFIDARNLVSFDGIGSSARSPSGAFSSVGQNATGQGGIVRIVTDSLSLTNGAQIGAGTFGRGAAGNIIVGARDSISFNSSSSGIFSSVSQGAVGQGGDIRIATRSFLLKNGAQIGASTSGRGNAGSILIEARSISFDDTSDSFPSGAFSSVRAGAIGQGGSVRIVTDSLSLANGAQIVASTSGQGNAGSILINARGNISFDERSRKGGPSGAFSSVNPTAIGKGGDITLITPNTFSITNGAALDVSSFGTEAGNINVNASKLRLNQSSIRSQALSGNGGNISLTVPSSLLLRQGSLISTTAGIAQAGGDGGNIRFNGGFIIAVPSENSNITANAFTGRGGRVDITAQSLYGIQSRPRLTDLSDITASSELGISGIVTINSPDIDPNRGLIALPEAPRTAEITQSCQMSGSRTASRFVITGRGGLPTNPRETLSSDEILVSLVEPNYTEERQSNQDSTRSTDTTAKIVEAQGWIIDRNGNVTLVSQTPAALSERFRQSINCSNF